MNFFNVTGFPRYLQHILGQDRRFFTCPMKLLTHFLPARSTTNSKTENTYRRLLLTLDVNIQSPFQQQQQQQQHAEHKRVGGDVDRLIDRRE